VLDEVGTAVLGSHGIPRSSVVRVRPRNTSNTRPRTPFAGPLPHRRSPQQISRRLVVDFPDDEDMRISHEAIYQALYIQGRGALRRELVACLRTGRALRKPESARATSRRVISAPTSCSVNDPPRPRTVRSPVTGKAT
jgi:IS30 family transposase